MCNDFGLLSFLFDTRNLKNLEYPKYKIGNGNCRNPENIENSKNTENLGDVKNLENLKNCRENMLENLNNYRTENTEKANIENPFKNRKSEIFEI